MKSPAEEASNKPLPFSTVLKNSNSDSKSPFYSLNLKSESHSKPHFNNNNHESDQIKEFEAFRHESHYEHSKLTLENQELRNQNLELERKQAVLIGDIDKQSLLLNEKTHEIEYWRSKHASIESLLATQRSELDKVVRMNSDLNEVIEKWKQKYQEFERVHLEQQNQFEALKIKYKRLEKKREMTDKELQEFKEQGARSEAVKGGLELENEKLRRTCQELEVTQGKLIEELDCMKRDFDEYKSHSESALEEAREEGVRMINDLHKNYQEVIHRKHQSESQSKQLLDQIKELTAKLQKQDSVISEKENAIVDLGLKLTQAENTIASLNYQLAQKEQSMFKLRTESSNIANGVVSRFLPENGPGNKLLEARVEKQQAEIISLKKSIEFNEKFRNNEKFILGLKEKDKEIEDLRAKIKGFEAKSLKGSRTDPVLEDLKVKIVLLSSENERLHSVIRQIPERDYDIMRDNPTKVRENRDNYQENDTIPRVSTRIGPAFREDFMNSPTRREFFDVGSLYSPSYRQNDGKKASLLRDFEESSRQLRELEEKLHDSLRKREGFLGLLGRPRDYY